MLIGGGERLARSMVFNSFYGNGTLSAQSPILLLSPGPSGSHSITVSSTSTCSASTKRNSKGVQALLMIRKLMSARRNWFPIFSANDYHFPGQFHHNHPQRMGYCDDITSLGHYVASDPDFLFNDIQLGKGKCRGWNEVTVTIGADENGTEESLKVRYKIAPCNGVKLCGMHHEGCSFVAATREFRKCPEHPNAALIKTDGCPVEFVYIRPASSEDNRRWLTGIDRHSDMHSDNLHSHPLNAPSKIPTKVESDIRDAVAANPHLKAKEVMRGKYCGSYKYAEFFLS